MYNVGLLYLGFSHSFRMFLRKVITLAEIDTGDPAIFDYHDLE